MKVPTVTNFFFVFDLTVGGLMLGYLGAIANATFAIMLLIDLVFNVDGFKHEVFNITRSIKVMSPGTYTGKYGIESWLARSMVKNLFYYSFCASGYCGDWHFGDVLLDFCFVFARCQRSKNLNLFLLKN
jgi:hypothetical protein